MKRFFVLAAILAAACSLHAQVVDANVCDILKNPQAFNGKMVRVKGTVAAGFEQFAILGKNCGQKVDAIWLAYPDGTKSKAGPAVMIQFQPASNFTGKVTAEKRAPVTLQQDKAFKEFDKRLAEKHKSDGICLGCNRYEVSATMVGRLDGSATAGVTRDKAGKIVGISGFGNMNAYHARLVLQSVSDVTEHEIDYSKTAEASKGEQLPRPIGKPDKVIDSAIKAYPAGNPLAEMLSRAVGAFGKPGEQNGVIVGFDSAGTLNSSREGKGSISSPDGVLYYCTFDTHRLKDDALGIATAFAGSVIADTRSPKGPISGSPAYVLDFQAWQTAVVSTIGLRIKTLTAPDGYLLWNLGWKAEERDSQLQAGLALYLDQVALFTR